MARLLLRYRARDAPTGRRRRRRAAPPAGGRRARRGRTRRPATRARASGAGGVADGPHGPAANRRSSGASAGRRARCAEPVVGVERAGILWRAKRAIMAAMATQGRLASAETVAFMVLAGIAVGLCSGLRPRPPAAHHAGVHGGRGLRRFRRRPLCRVPGDEVRGTIRRHVGRRTDERDTARLLASRARPALLLVLSAGCAVVAAVAGRDAVPALVGALLVVVYWGLEALTWRRARERRRPAPWPSALGGMVVRFARRARRPRRRRAASTAPGPATPSCRSSSCYTVYLGVRRAHPRRRTRAWPPG